MKKQIQLIRFFLLAGLFITNLVANASNNVMTSNDLCFIENNECFDEVFTYSWTAEPGAVTYVVDMVNTSTQESFNWETTQTSITAFSLPNGTYDLTVTAKFADSSSSIIIDDLIQH